MKRDTCIGSGDVAVNPIATLSSTNNTLCINVTQFSCAVKDFSGEFSDGGIANKDIDLYLKALLKDSNFTQMVREAVLKCFNSGTTDCGLAKAALTLQDTIKKYTAENITHSTEAYITNDNCALTDVETLCWANTYTVNLLNEVFGK